MLEPRAAILAQFCFPDGETIHAEGGEVDVVHRTKLPDKVGVRQLETERVNIAARGSRSLTHFCSSAPDTVSPNQNSSGVAKMMVFEHRSAAYILYVSIGAQKNAICSPPGRILVQALRLFTMPPIRSSVVLYSSTSRTLQPCSPTSSAVFRSNNSVRSRNLEIMPRFCSLALWKPLAS
jgi:hypothetical protein